ncbi:hypothetical protein [Herminiimonas sp. CN]|uniref:hypothetical protein n=1 Tax=Herminiimonas sp. CN TaxID=1349818 RepID=UPI000473BF02|nr:hypothetical protein [Herminiimonas sp. CN]
MLLIDSPSLPQRLFGDHETHILRGKDNLRKAIPDAAQDSRALPNRMEALDGRTGIGFDAADWPGFAADPGAIKGKQDLSADKFWHVRQTADRSWRTMNA